MGLDQFLTLQKFNIRATWMQAVNNYKSSTVTILQHKYIHGLTSILHTLPLSYDIQSFTLRAPSLKYLVFPLDNISVILSQNCIKPADLSIHTYIDYCIHYNQYVYTQQKKPYKVCSLPTSSFPCTKYSYRNDTER